MAENKEATQSTKGINRERFVRIAEKRVNKILDSIDSLANCSNKKNYEYNEQDVRKIFTEIERKLKDARAFFQDSNQTKTSFRLEK